MIKYYDLSSALDTLEFQAEAFMSVLETLAASDNDDLTSGTMWFIHDTVKRYKEQIAMISALAMDSHIEEQNLETKKGKKK